MKYTISRHAQERYAQRIMDKDCKADMNVFISNYITKISGDINKMIEFGDLLFEGKSINGDYNKAVIEIYRKDNWIILVDPARNNVITLFSIDLGVGQEMNEIYISRLMEKLDKAKEAVAEKCKEAEEQKATYEELIASNNSTIESYRTIINSLEEQNKSYQTLIKELDTNKVIAETEVREVIGILTSKPIF